MNRIFVFTAVMALASLVFGQEDYSEWAGSRAIRVNTTAAGANVPGSVSQFPLLVRLTSSNFPGFAQSAADGSDIRFTRPNGLQRLPHQIERWDAANQIADVWVLAENVAGNEDAIAMRVYWGKTGAPNLSNGSEVFSASNGFLAVFHLNEGAGDTIRDATGGFKGAPAGGTAPSPVVNTGAGQYISGAYRDFPGGSAVGTGGSYRLFTAAGGSTGTGPLSFSSEANNVFSISFWMNVDNFYGTSNQRRGIVAKTGSALAGNTAATGMQWHFRSLSGAAAAGDTNAFEYVDNTTNDYSMLIRKQGITTTGQWNFVTLVRSSPEEAQIYNHNANGVGIDDRSIMSTSKPITSVEQPSVDVFIGSYAGSGNAGTGFFDGKLDEVRFSNVARSPDWIKLSYETQKPAVTAVTLTTDPPINVFGHTDPAAPGRITIKVSGRSLVFGLSQAAEEGTGISVVDARGRPVWSRTLQQGAREAVWHGNFANGSPAASGVYFVRVGNAGAARKFIYTP